MDLNQRKLWNENHKKLTNIILNRNEHHTSIKLFLNQHSLIHSSKMSNSVITTLEDELIKDIIEDTIRRYPVAAPDTRNSIAWHIWHITRIEDMTMNIFVHNDNQVFYSGDWYKQLGVEYRHSGNEMKENEVDDLSSKIDLPALFEYRIAVGRRTRDIVSNLEPGDFNK